MYLPDISTDRYRTDPARHGAAMKRRLFKGPYWFYPRYAFLVAWAGLKAFFSKDPQKSVILQSLRVMKIAEYQGADMSFEGLDRFPSDQGPYVFACNHMGTLEVNLLPGLVGSRTPMTFVVKEKLLKGPFMGRVLRGLRAIPVARKNPGEDLMQVLNVGTQLLGEGISVILFPEGTRQDVFSERQFNSLAVKLALRAGVPVVPVAVKTDFWGVGEKIKELGALDPKKKVMVSFGDPVLPKGRGKDEHRKVLDFVTAKLTEWGAAIAPHE